MKFRCLIVDDEQLARELIEMYCNKNARIRGGWIMQKTLKKPWQ